MGYRGPGPLGTDYNNPIREPGDFNFGGSSSPWSSGIRQVPLDRDDIIFLVDYIVAEMNTNAHSPFTKGLAALNRFPPDDCIEDIGKLPPEMQRVLAVLDLSGLLARCVGKHLTNRKLALILWAEKVKDKADWDHKPIIKRRFPSSISCFNDEHLYGHHVYNHDIWSNIHYGYVGMAAGFSEWELILGAAVAHVRSRWNNAELFEEHLDIILEKLGDNPMTWDDPKDKAAINVGIRLYQYRPERVTVRDLMGEVWFSRNSLAIRPYDPRFDRVTY
ncbi:polymorphic toxin type 44 domain-containing protein [Candidatus Thiosymbion oneisti]|uniref:polymorphic toxin type 44 domain-containing protein n=1 Tax=Candidatus Thiosymbion oneisti TaxID=589554 RepID=UPI000AEB036E|nr:polymorphic toxin type 44 domain-containing protein [Candidatus Thiosymbion oneisti]